jgi:hypothetical protein
MGTHRSSPQEYQRNKRDQESGRGKLRRKAGRQKMRNRVGYDGFGGISRRMSKGRGNLGIAHEKVYDFWEKNDESGYNCKHEGKRKKTGELARRYCDKRRLIAMDRMTSAGSCTRGTGASRFPKYRNLDAIEMTMWNIVNCAES